MSVGCKKTDINTDNDNCGTCGAVCNGTEICSSGHCCPNGERQLHAAAAVVPSCPAVASASPGRPASPFVTLLTLPRALQATRGAMLPTPAPSAALTLIVWEKMKSAAVGCAPLTTRHQIVQPVATSAKPTSNVSPASVQRSQLSAIQ